MRRLDAHIGGNLIRWEQLWKVRQLGFLVTTYTNLLLEVVVEMESELVI